MGCDNTDVATLAGFLDIPATWMSVARHMKGAEAVMGPLPMLNREEGEMDDLTDEVQSYIDHDDHITHECTI